MFTPAGILKMWKRVNTRFGLVGDETKGKAKEKEKKPSPKAKQAEKEDARVNKRLLELRTLGHGDLGEPGPARKFVKSRDKAAKAMKKYCKLLKSNDLKESVQDLTKFRKAVKQLVVVVESLDARPYADDGEGGEPDLNALEKVDTAALDKAMEDPNFGEYSDAELDQDEPEPEPVAKPTAKTAEDPAARFKARLAEWTPAIKAAMAAKGPKAADIAKLLGQATALSKPGGDLALALDKLTQCHILADGAAGPAAPTEDLAATFKSRLQALTPGYQQALKGGGPNRGALEVAMKMALAAAKSQDYEQGLIQLDKLEAELAKGGPAPEAKDPAELFKQRVQAFRPAFNAALAQARADKSDVAEDLDGLFAQMFDEAKAKKFEKALGTLDQLIALVGKQKAGPAGPAAEKQAAASPATPAASWDAELKAAVARLEAEIREVVATKDPDAGKAELELRAVLRQIKAKVTTRQQAAEMQRYLDQDSVVADVCELAFDLKTPLLKALGELTPQLSA